MLNAASTSSVTNQLATCYWFYDTRNKNITAANLLDNIPSLDIAKYPTQNINCFNTFEEAKSALAMVFSSKSVRQGGARAGIIFSCIGSIETVRAVFAAKNKVELAKIDLKSIAEFVRDEKDELKQLGQAALSASAISEKVFKPLLSGTPVSKIPYMDKLPHQGGELIWLTPAQFREKFQCEFQEGIFSSDPSHQVIEPASLEDKLLIAAYERLQNPFEDFVICNMGEYGYGLFTCKAIPRGKLIGIYSGVYDPSIKDSIYNCQGISAMHIAGFARFMQHLPYSSSTHAAYLINILFDAELYALIYNVSVEKAKNTISNRSYVTEMMENIKAQVTHAKWQAHYDFDRIKFVNPTESIIKNRHITHTIKLKNQQHESEIADSNIFYIKIPLGDTTAIVMLAMRDIQAGEIVGFSYGEHYWTNPLVGHPPVLFTKQGEVIPAKNNYVYPEPVPENRLSLPRP